MAQPDIGICVSHSGKIVLGISDIAGSIVSADSEQQAAFFSTMARSVDEWSLDDSWPEQCRMMTDFMTGAECDLIASTLETLTEHLRAVPTERRAAALAAEIVDGVAAVVEECR